MQQSTGKPCPKRIEVIVRGLMEHGEHVLLCKDRDGGYLYLPGGHVEPGEASPAALIRELHEEAALRDVRVGDFVLVTEERFSHAGKPKHEVNLVFHVEQAHTESSTPLLSGGGSPDVANPPAVQSREDHIEFVWVRRNAVQELDVRPESIRTWLSAQYQAGQTPVWMGCRE